MSNKEQIRARRGLRAETGYRGLRMQSRVDNDIFKAKLRKKTRIDLYAKTKKKICQYDGCDTEYLSSERSKYCPECRVLVVEEGREYASRKNKSDKEAYVEVGNAILAIERRKAEIKRQQRKR